MTELTTAETLIASLEARKTALIEEANRVVAEYNGRIAEVQNTITMLTPKPPDSTPPSDERKSAVEDNSIGSSNEGEKV